MCIRDSTGPIESDRIMAILEEMRFQRRIEEYIWFEQYQHDVDQYIQSIRNGKIDIDCKPPKSNAQMIER